MKLVPAAAPAASSYACPMHREVTASEPGTCPQCGMKLVPATRSGRTCRRRPNQPAMTTATAWSGRT